MTVKSALAATTAALLLSSCTSGFVPLLGGGITIAEAEVENDALIARRNSILAAEGQTMTAELPATGTATFTGIIHGNEFGGDGPEIEYYADLWLEADFDNDAISGEVTNFVTDLADFENPAGTATLTGAISNLGGTATNDFTATGILVGTSVGAPPTAIYDADAIGIFVGDSAQAAFGTHSTNFFWIDGPDTGTASSSDGEWNAEQ